MLDCGPGKTHALERESRCGWLTRLQPGVADGEVGLVAQRHELRPLRLDLAHRVEQRESARRVAGAHQRDAEVELTVGEPVARTLPVREFGDGLVVAFEVQQALRDQQVPLGLHVLSERAADLAQRAV